MRDEWRSWTGPSRRTRRTPRPIFSAGCCTASWRTRTGRRRTSAPQSGLDGGSAEAYYNRGVAYAVLQQPIMAVDDFAAAIALDPRHVDAYNNRAAAYLDLGHPGEAIQDAEAAMRLDDQLPSAYAIRGIARAQLGQADLAKQDMERAQALSGQ